MDGGGQMSDTVRIEEVVKKAIGYDFLQVWQH